MVKRNLSRVPGVVSRGSRSIYRYRSQTRLLAGRLPVSAKKQKPLPQAKPQGEAPDSSGLNPESGSGVTRGSEPKAESPNPKPVA